VKRNRPAMPYSAAGGGGTFSAGVMKRTVLDVGGTQPEEMVACGAGEIWDPNVSFQPLGVSCQMSLLG
jgi:hypothetical protein